MRTYWWSGCIAPHILNLGTRCRWVVIFMLRPLYPWYKFGRGINAVALSNCMEQSPPREANSHSAIQKILSLLWNLKFHNRVYKGPIWSQAWTNWKFSLHSHILFRQDPFLFYPRHLRLVFLGLFPSDFVTEIPYAVSPSCVLHASPILNTLVWSHQ